MTPGGDAASKLAEAEVALAAGHPEEARLRLAELPTSAVTDIVLPRLLDVMAQTNRFLSRQRDTVAWIEHRLASETTPPTRVLLYSARIAALRQVDPGHALDLVDEALAAARAQHDAGAMAKVLAHAAFCAYRVGDPRRAARFAEEAKKLAPTSPVGQIDMLRAQMFAAVAAGHIEESLVLTTTLRDRQLVLGDLAGAANECNNRAEELLRLGRAPDAGASARDGAELARRAGHRAVERFAEVLGALSAAECGQLGAGIAALRRVEGSEENPIFAIDTATALAFWLVERREAGDASAAIEVARRGVERAQNAGVRHHMTRMHATCARALALCGQVAPAREELAMARSHAVDADSESELHLAMTMAEVLSPGEPAREVALRAARTRLLLAAARREDPRRYCTGVRLHRRLLELSGGIPGDLPGPG